MPFTVIFDDGTNCGHAHRLAEQAQGCCSRKGGKEIQEIESRADLKKTDPAPIKEKKTAAKKFSVEKRFDILKTISGMVCRGSQRSIFVAGNGGTGKTFTIFDEIEKHGLTKEEVTITSDDDNVVTSDSDAYIKVSGASSPLGLYRVLYENSDSLIVFDDCDGFLNNDNAVNILKAVLDTSGDGTVSWRSPIVERMGLPDSFQFRGRAIFISNKEINKIPQPILSRSLILDITLDNREICERARMLGDKLLPALSLDQRAALFDFVEEHANEFRDVSLRTFVLAAPYIAEGRTDWKDLVLFTS